ncbi:MAG: PEGA domain-containing protein, partial [Methanomicrobiales archaeon]|nr:PEGA domain-containing protein [Methanomicrobiales archaeon]
SNTSVKVWYTGAQLSVSPPSATNPVGTSHTIVATLKYPDGTPLPDEPLTFTIVSGPNTGRTEDAWTNISGFAAFSYIGLNTGTDTVKVTYTGNRAVEIISNTSVKVWYTGAQLSVSPPSATNPVGTSHTIVATLKYPDGTPLSDEPLTFTIVSGPNTGRTEDAWTNISGSAAFSYTGTSAGTDTVKVTYTGDRAVEIISNTSVKVWISSTDVTITNITPSSGREDGNGPLNPPVFWDPAIVGTGFQVGAVVKLQKEGETDIIGKNVVVESPGKITCIFDLTRRTPGYWDVVVINPDGSSARLPGGFYVQPTGPACIIITTIPQGARLTLDGADFGVSTRTLYGLSEGTHTITATLEGYQNWEGTFYVKYPMIKNLITIRMTKIPATTGDIAILTIPRNADVVLDGTWYGKTPLMVKAITKGSHTLSLKLGGYVPYQGTVTVTAGKTTYISKVLMPSITSIIR